MPLAGLIAYQGALYGTTQYGGTGCNTSYSGCGTVFEITGSGFDTIAAVPEPSSLGLIGTAMVALIGLAQWRRRKGTMPFQNRIQDGDKRERPIHSVQLRSAGKQASLPLKQPLLLALVLLRLLERCRVYQWNGRLPALE